MDTFKGILSTEIIHLAALTEIKPKHGEIPSEDMYSIRGYDHFLNPSFENTDTRGVILYAKEYLKATVVKCDENSRFKDCVWVRIPVKNSAMLVGVIYRSGTPAKAIPQDKELHDMIQHMTLNKGYKCVVIMGDFNHPKISWTPDPVITVDHRNDDHPEYQFVNTINNSMLHQHISRATRDRDGQQSNICDLIFTSDIDMLTNIQHTGHLDKSDHQTITFDLCNTFSKFIPKTTTRFKYKLANIQEIEKSMNKNWDELLANKSSEEAYSIFLNAYKEARDRHVPKVTSTSSDKYQKPIWMKPSTLRLIRRKKSAHIKYLNTRRIYDRERYKSLRNQVTNTVKQDRVAFERNISKEIRNNNKLFWRYVNAQRTTKSTIPDLKRPDGTLATEDKEKAELLNLQFNSVYTKEDLKNIPEFEDLHLDTFLDEIKIEKQDVKKILKNLKTDKSCGPDEVHPYILQKLADLISTPLTMIFKQSLQTGIVPKIWKEGIVSALFKKGNRSLAANYRPITLTSVVCKVLERLIVVKIVQHLTKNNLQNPHQHGFTIKKSTMTNLIEALNIWSEALSHGLSLDIIYLDYEKAFDKVPHQRLLRQLSRFGIKGQTLNWIKDYLSARTQKVRLNGTLSSQTTVLSGVPQGSVLGPALFLIFVADLSPLIKNFISFYADDTKLFSYILDSKDHMHTPESIQNDINTLTAWSEKMQMSFNAEKCHTLHLGNKNPKTNYTLAKMINIKQSTSSIKYTLHFYTLEEVDEEKDLGVLVDKNLNFKSHISKKISKANSMLYLIKNSFKFLDKQIFTMLYKSLVRPHLEYVSPVWNPITSREIKKLEGVQRRATKMVPELTNLPYTERLKALNLPTLQYRRLRQDLIFIYNYVNQNLILDTHTYCKTCRTPQDMLTPVTSGSRGHPYRYTIQRHPGIRRKFLTSRAIPQWNKLQAETVTAPNINLFKSRLKKDPSMPCMITFPTITASN